MVKVVKRFSYNRNFVPWGYLPLPLDYLHALSCVIFKFLLL